MALTTREAFARTMEHMCRHDGDGGHGYSQIAREGDGTYETVDLGDGATVRIANGDRDCSSAIVTALKAVGVDTHGATYTGNMRGELLKTGLFDWHPMGDGYIAQRGDIYLNETHHTAMCTSSDPDMLAQFSRSETHGISGRKGDQDGWESNIRGYYNYPWDGKLAWRGDGGTFGNAGAEPSYAEPAQDSTFADCTWLQRIVGADHDNIWGPDTAKRVGAVQLASAYWGESFPYGVAYTQSVIGADADGIWGVNSRAAHDSIVERIQEGFGIDVDGIWGKVTDGCVHDLHLKSNHTA